MIMKKSMFFSVLCTLALSTVAQQNQKPGPEKRLAKYVVLINIDGLRPDFYLDPAWPTPIFNILNLLTETY